MNASAERTEALRRDFTRIVRGWKKALEQPKTEFTRDSAILRFELAYEVSWKLLQLLLRERVFACGNSSPGVPACFYRGLDC